MRQKPGPQKPSAEKVVKDIRRRTRKQHSAEEKIRIVLEGLRGEVTIAELCRREGIATSLYYSWSKEFLEAGKTITETTGLPGGAHLHASMGDYGTMVMVTNAGATYLSADGTEAGFDSPEGIAAMAGAGVSTPPGRPGSSSRQMAASAMIFEVEP